MTGWWQRRLVLVCSLVSGALLLSREGYAADVHDVFREPPRQARLQMWYHWIGDCVTEEGIVADLKAMGELGVGAAHVFAPSMAHLPVKAKPMSPEWMRLFAVAIREAKRNDIELGFHNCPGWSSSGGPWITPENSMKVVVSSSVDVDVGKCGGSVRLPQPLTERGYYKDIAVLAFPIPVPVPLAANPFPKALGIAEPDRTASFELNYLRPVRARYLRFKTQEARLCAKLQVEAFFEGAWQPVGRAEWGPWTGTKDYRVVRLSRSVEAARYRVTLMSKPVPDWMGKHDAVILAAEMTDLAFVPDIAEKNSSTVSCGHHSPSDPNEKGIDPSSVLNLTANLQPDGTVNLSTSQLPNLSTSHLRLVRIGCTTTGKGPAPATVGGLECDKLDRKGIDAHWAAMPAKILALPGAKDTVKYCIIDSYEAGGQNWTDRLPTEFKKRRGRAIGRNLLGVCGYVVGTARETYDFLWDWQQTIGELFAENYYDRFTELCHQSGVKSIIEPYGGPFDPLRCGKSADIPTGEFWLGGNTCGGSLDRVRQIGLVHGKNLIAAESFTTEAAEGRWQITPHELRVAGDQTGWINGVNQIVFHSYVHQPFGAVKPGLSLGRHGTQFNRNTTWWPEARWWGDYVRRGQALLQYGRPGVSSDGVVAADLPSGLRALRREGAAGERIYFIVNTTDVPFGGAVGLCAPKGSVPELFDAKAGLVTAMSCPSPDKDGRVRVNVDLSAKGSAFVVFSPASRVRPTGRTVRQPDAPAIPVAWKDVSDGWKIVSFDGPNAPKTPVVLDRLASWSASDDLALRHFSGRATYEKKVERVEKVGKGEAVWLDLGDVRDVANVWVDDTFVGCLWEPPYKVDITSALVSRSPSLIPDFTLRVEIINTWPNRLIGDAAARARGCAEPCVKEGPWPKWVLAGKPDSGTGIFTWSNWLGGWKATDALKSAGLIGPVRIGVAGEPNATVRRRRAAIRTTPNWTVPTGAVCRYVSAKTGDDAANGLTPRTAWRTLARLNEDELPPGAFVLFERGGIYRGTIRARSGVTYTAYGEGSKPCIVGSPEDGADPAKWRRTENPKVWAHPIGTRDVGTLVFNGGEAHAVKVLVRTDAKTGRKTDQRTGKPFESYRDLSRDLDFWHDYYAGGTGLLYLYSEKNPGERFRSIEFNANRAGVSVRRENDVTIDNLCFKYIGGHGVSAGTCRNLTVSNCEFAWIGGSIQMEKGFGRDYPTRYGNAVEVYGGCDGFMVTNCLISQIYDAGVTHQFNVPPNEGVKRYDQKNILYADNVIENCNYSFEWFLRAPKSNPSRMENVLVRDNICLDAGFGFCEERPDKGGAAHVKAWGGPGANRAVDCVIRDNAFFGGKDKALDIGKGFVLSRNCLGEHRRVVLCWGDSITEGMAMPQGKSYPACLQRLLGSGYTVLNSGDGGEDAVTICARQGALELRTSKEIRFGKGQDKVKIGDAADNGISTPDGRPLRLTAALGRQVPVNDLTIAGRRYRLKLENFKWNTATNPISYQAWLERVEGDEPLVLTSGTPVALASETASGTAACEIVLMGANGGWNNRVEDLIELYRKMINRRGPDGAYLAIVPYWYGFTPEQEKAFCRAFGSHAVLFREEAIRRGLAEEGLTPTDPDRSEMAAGRVPTSLLYQGKVDVHMNEYGYDFLAKLVFEQGRKLGYW